MKKTLYTSILILIGFFSFAQRPVIIDRSTPSVITRDARTWPKTTFGFPIFSDSNAALASIGIDTISFSFYNLADSSLYVRVPKTSGSGNFWSKIGSGGTVTTTAPITGGAAGVPIALTYNSNYLDVFSGSLVTKTPVFTTYPSLRSIAANELVAGAVYGVVINGQMGQFIWDATSTVADDSAMYIQRTGTATGRFVRVVNTYINAAWFGCVGDGSTDNSAAMQKLFDWVQNHPLTTYSIWFPPGNYKVNTTVTLPNKIATTAESIRLTIEGYGARIFTTNGITIWKRMPTSQTQAQDTLISNWIGSIKGFVFEGNNTAGQTGMRLGAMFSWTVQDCNFSSLDTGMVVHFSLGGTFRNLRFTANTYENFNVNSGAVWGGNDGNSGSNANLIENIRVYGYTGAYSHFHSDASDAVLIKNFISEGAKPRYNFILDAHSSSTVKTCVVDDIHVEASGGSIGTNTVFKIVAGGKFTIKNVFLQYSDTLFNTVGSASGSLIEFDGIPYIGSMPAGVTFNAGGGSTLGYNIVFRNISGGATFKSKLFSTAAWNGGVVPFETFLYYQKESGSGVMAFASGGAIHLEPASGSADGALGQSVNIRGHLYSETDNFYRWGVVSSFGDQRPLAIYSGTEGIFVDTLGSLGFNHSGGTMDVSITRRANGVGKFNFTGQVQMPTGNTAQRKSASAGDIRYNTDSARLEFHNGSAWNAVSVSSDITTGGEGIIKSGATLNLGNTNNSTTGAFTVDRYVPLGAQKLRFRNTAGTTFTDAYAGRFEHTLAAAGDVRVINPITSESSQLKWHDGRFTSVTEDPSITNEIISRGFNFRSNTRVDNTKAALGESIESNWRTSVGGSRIMEWYKTHINEAGTSKRIEMWNINDDQTSTNVVYAVDAFRIANPVDINAPYVSVNRTASLAHAGEYSALLEFAADPSAVASGNIRLRYDAVADAWNLENTLSSGALLLNGWSSVENTHASGLFSAKEFRMPTNGTGYLSLGTTPALIFPNQTSVYLGYQAGRGNGASITPDVANTDNIAMGYIAGNFTTGNRNFVAMNYAARYLTTGSGNVIIGHAAANSQTGQDWANKTIIIGDSAMIDNVNYAQVKNGVVWIHPYKNNTPWLRGVADNNGTNKAAFNSVTEPLVSLELGGTDALLLTKGSTAQRPTGVNGYIRYNSETEKFEGYENGAWANFMNSGGGSINLAAIGSTPNANGASLSGDTLTLQPANETYGGVVTTGTQTFAGQKTFTGDVRVSGSDIISLNAGSGFRIAQTNGSPGANDLLMYNPSSGTPLYKFTDWNTGSKGITIQTNQTNAGVGIGTNPNDSYDFTVNKLWAFNTTYGINGYAPTSGNNPITYHSTNFNPTSGTGVLSLVYLEPTINQTGGANGNIYGVKFAPVNTSVGGTVIPFTNTTGSNYFNTSSGDFGIGFSEGASLTKKFNVSGTSYFGGLATYGADYSPSADRDIPDIGKVNQLITASTTLQAVTTNGSTTNVNVSFQGTGVSISSISGTTNVFAGTSFGAEMSSSNTPALISNSSTSNGVVTSAYFQRSGTYTAANDDGLQMRFASKNSAGTSKDFFLMDAVLQNATASSERGGLLFKFMTGGTAAATKFTFNGDGSSTQVGKAEYGSDLYASYTDRTLTDWGNVKKAINDSLTANLEAVDIYEVTTTDATETTIATITPTASETITIEAEIVGKKVDGSSSVVGTKKRSFNNTSGNTLTAGTLQTTSAVEYIAGTLSTATFTIKASGGNMLVTVTGEAATSISWKVFVRVRRG